MCYRSDSILQRSGFDEHKLFSLIPPCLLYHPTFVICYVLRGFYHLFVNNKSLTSQGCPASQTQTQVAHSTAYTDSQTRANHTKTCFLTFLSSLCSHLNTVTMTFIPPVTETDDGTHTCLWLSGRWHLAQTRQTETQKKEQQLSKSIFTAAWATGTENKHQTQKTLLWIHYWKEWLSWLRGIKGTEAALCWANVVLPRQPHPPVMTGDQPGHKNEAKDRKANTQSHQLYLPLRLSKGNIITLMVE